MLHIFSYTPDHHKVLGGLGSNAQNNAVSSTEMLANSCQPFFIWRLPNISFLCRCGHFTQFLTKKFDENWTSTLPIPWGMGLVNVIFVCRSGDFMQVFVIKYFCQLSSTYPHKGWDLVNMSFLYRSCMLIQFLEETMWGYIELLPHHWSNKGGVWQTWLFCADLDISFSS